jgi:DNA polymerase III alpha subunit
VETGPNNECALRVGLMQVRGLQVETITAITQSRNKAGEFVSLEDFLRRVPVNVDEIEALIKCGAFDDVCTTMTRPEMLWRWNLLQAEEKKAHSGTLAATARDLMNAMFAESKPEDRIDLALAGMHIAQYTEEQKLGYELEILEICVSGHPLDYMARNDEVWSDELSGLRGERVTLCGWVVTHRHVGTKNDRDMMFVTLEDQHGVYEVVLFPDTYERYGSLIFETRAMRVTGRVEPDGQINCEMLAPLEKIKVHHDSKSISN